MDEYQIKNLGSYLQDLGTYLIEHPDMIQEAELSYAPDITVEKISYISYQNKGTISIKVVTK